MKPITAFFPAAFDQDDDLYAEPRADGIALMKTSPQGEDKQYVLLPFDEVINQLDSGLYDDAPLAGHCVLAALGKACVLGYFEPGNGQSLITWRWLISMAFITEQQVANGMMEVDNSEGGTDTAALYMGKHGGMPLYPRAERLLMANSIEGAFIAQHGEAEGTSKAIAFYIAMRGEGEACLSDMGREFLADLHDDFIHTFNTIGLPLHRLH